MNTATKQLITGIAMILFGMLGLGIVGYGIWTHAFKLIHILPAIGAFLFLVAGIVNIRDGLQPRSESSTAAQTQSSVAVSQPKARGEYPFAEWDDEDFILPEELVLTDDSYLHEAIEVFYKAGGFSFFQVIDADQYSPNWLDFVGGLYSDIEEGKYKPDGNCHKNPLSDFKKQVLTEQGVPEIFIEDLR